MDNFFTQMQDFQKVMTARAIDLAVADGDIALCDLVNVQLTNILYDDDEIYITISLWGNTFEPEEIYVTLSSELAMYTDEQWVEYMCGYLEYLSDSNIVETNTQLKEILYSGICLN